MTAWAARLDALPRLLLVTEPTPIIRARRLSAALGGPTLWFKRDDLLPMAFGGNKVRSLDLVVAEALRRGADTLVTGAGPLSNHVRASAAVSALAELRCIAVYWGAAPARAEGNYWLTRMLGAEIRFTGDSDRTSVDRGVEAAVADVVARGGRPYVIPRGGACAVAVLAHVLAVRETLDQCAALGVAPKVVVLAVGGAATLAGWLWRSMAPRGNNGQSPCERYVGSSSCLRRAPKACFSTQFTPARPWPGTAACCPKVDMPASMTFFSSIPAALRVCSPLPWRDCHE
jgi:1-aminocyclopropane-1-carboxylate deaminase/D-cysteine desulfhydrase-like pyridoxal-dependent ACC family enzyme